MEKSIRVLIRVAVQGENDRDARRCLALGSKLRPNKWEYDLARSHKDHKAFVNSHREHVDGCILEMHPHGEQGDNVKVSEEDCTFPDNSPEQSGRLVGQSQFEVSEAAALENF